MNIVIIGANGQLGTDLAIEAHRRKWQVTALTHVDVRIESADSVRSVIPPTTEVLINTAAFHNVEKCESEPARAYEVNAIGPAVLASWAEEHGARLFQISTDYVFGGEQNTPYVESDHPAPVNTYGITKLAGEHAALAYNSSAVVIRVSGLYGMAQCRAKGGENFVKLMLRLGQERGHVKVVTDQWVSPTWTVPLAAQLCDLAALKDVHGVVHATSSEACTWFEFARAIFSKAGMNVQVSPVASAEFPSPVRRPAYTVLENARLRSLGIDHMPSWRQALDQYLAAFHGP